MSKKIMKNIPLFVWMTVLAGMVLITSDSGAQYNQTESYESQQPGKSQNVALYYHPNCPHCKDVLRYLTKINKTLPMKNTGVASYREELRRLGKTGVPALVVNGRVITGSQPIISYLESHQEIFD